MPPTTDSPIHGGYCSGCGTFTAVATCPLSPNASAELCGFCWDREMDYRRGVNRRRPEWAQVGLHAWPVDDMGASDTEVRPHTAAEVGR